ncbi:TonB-dependent receptor [hydrothermal vent metagenome]|uniref:TonB-dependent receptor n=1 Tax=hydrothermal vent metagenome TaxID=652676 RepID=A0A3B0T9E7_9ZZZZ
MNIHTPDKHKSLLRYSVSAFAVAAILTTGIQPSSAADDAADEDLILEEVTVTGSRIKRKDLIATSPVNIITTEAIELTGSTHVANYINELPSAGVPGSVDTGTNFRTATTGLNTVDLRNLGVQRTLVLVNGRRHVGGSAGSPTVDLSMIPAALVKRVEVVTGGASAVYGSEAMAGVINFIMKDDFEGVELNARYGTSELGGASETDVSFLAGSNFADDRGNATVYLGYSKRGILRSSQRDVSANDATNSSFGPKGHFFAPGFSGGGWTQDDDTGLFNKPFVNAEDGFDRNAVRLIRVPSERIQFNANLNYQINDNVNFFNETSFNRLTASSQLEPSIVGFFISVGSIPNINVPIDNPFMPTELRDLILAADPTADHAIMFRRFTEIGPRTSDVQRQTFRTMFGLDGEINDNWDYEVYYQYGVNTQDQTNGGVYNTQNFLNALNVEDDGAGGFQCQDSLARDLGCVPINVFGAGTITGAALDFIRVNSQLTTRMVQQVAGATVTGNLLELPAGDVGVAFGAEWRKEKSAFNSDSLAASGLTSGNSTPNTVGQYDVYEMFAEAVVPILEDAPFADYLGLEAAIRHANYSTIGGNWAYKISADWRPVEDLRIRGGYSTAVRAPNIGELFNPGSETFRSFTDPCAFGGMGGASADGSTVYDVQSATVQANCATIAGTATLDPGGINIRSAGGLAAGNPDLNQEKANTWTIGAVYTPNFVPGLNITVDYFDIEITDAISSFTAQTTADQCVRQPDFPNNPFCSLIQRDTTTGLVLRIDALAINAAIRTTRGVDFALDYSTELGEGMIGFNLNGTRTLEYEFTPFEGGDVIDDLKEIGVPEWRINGTLTYDIGKFRFGWSTRFISGVNVDNDNPSAGPGTVGSYLYNDLQVRYTIDEDGQYEVFAGIDNIFDKAPPFLGQGVNGDVTGTNTAADIYDAIRRFGYVGIKARF